MPTLPRPLARPIRGTSARYATAFAIFGLALGMRQLIDRDLPPGFPYITFFPAVIGTTFLAGRGPGIVCAVLGGLAAWYWYIPPHTGFVVNHQIVTALVFYVFVVGIDIALIDGLQARQERLLENRQKLEALASHQTLLFKELQHRVANNLASVASMLRLQRRRIETEPHLAVELIDRADQRIELMGRIHRQLYDPDAIDVPVPAHLARVVEHVRNLSGRDGISVSVTVEPVRIEIGRLMTLSLLITELVSNSYKHAFPDDAPGQIIVMLQRRDDTELVLTVADNGRGMAPLDPSDRRGLGTPIVRGLAIQLGGALEISGDDGVRAVLRFPEG